MICMDEMSGWIRTEENLPKCDGKYGISEICFICDAFGRIGFGIYQDGRYMMHKGWFTGGNEDCARIDFWKPINSPIEKNL